MRTAATMTKTDGGRKLYPHQVRAMKELRKRPNVEIPVIPTYVGSLRNYLPYKRFAFSVITREQHPTYTVVTVQGVNECNGNLFYVFCRSFQAEHRIVEFFKNHKGQLVGEYEL